MAFNKNLSLHSLLMGVILLHLSCEAFALNCPLPLGLELSCPTMFNDEDKVFCCNSQENIPYCCNLGEYVVNHSAIIAGILVAAVIVLIIITICCCCFCSCCCLAKRRVSRGHVLYGPVSSTQTLPVSSATYVSSAYPLQSATVLHTPPSNSYVQQPPPPPYAPSGSQPPINPDYLTKK